MKTVFLAVISVALVLGGCGGETKSADTRSLRPTLSPSGLTGDDLAFSKFTEPVTVRVGMGLNPLSTSLPPGDTYADNELTRYLLDTFNIKIVVDWTAASGNDFTQRVSLAMASNALPDGLSTGLATIKKAAKSEMLYDLTDIFDMYASSQVKQIMATTQGRAIDAVTVDGKMVAIPGVTVDTDSVAVMNVLKSWLDMYGLPVPRTVDDIENVARVFKERQPAGADTIPIVGPGKDGPLYSTFNSALAGENTFDPVFAAYDLYPGFFLDNGDGTVSYGSLDPRMKQALEKLALWYHDGLIDPQLGVRDSPTESILSNTAGIRFGAWWGLGYGNLDSFKNDPTANWQSYPLYTDDGKWNSKIGTPTYLGGIVSANASPDTAAAIVILSNIMVRDVPKFDLALFDNYFPILFNIAPADETEYSYRALLKILSGEAEPEDYNDPMSVYKHLYRDTGIIRDVIPNFDPGRELSIQDFNTDIEGWNRAYAMLVGNRPFATVPIDKKVFSVTYTMTDLLERRWSNLETMEKEVMMGIVTGRSDISAFDKFTEDWLRQGGQEILDDLAAMN